VLLYGIFTGLTSLSTNFTMFAGLRFLTGLAIGSEWSTGVALIAETWPQLSNPSSFAEFPEWEFGATTTPFYLKRV
jgi:MFS family permease